MLNPLDALEALDVSKLSFGGATVRRQDDRQPPLVLVVDDDIDSLVLMCHVLEKFACIPVCETNGQAALDIINVYKPELIVLDIRLPEVDGLQIMRSLKRREGTREIPVIVVTALANYEDRKQILCVGCNHYVTKPYLLKDIEQLVQTYLALRKSEV